MKAYRTTRACRLWFSCFLAANLLVACIGLIANPHRLLPIYVTIPGINDIQPALYDEQRYVRLFDLANRQFGTVLIGSSRVLWGLDPQSQWLQKDAPAYNAGVLGPPMYEMKEYFDHALANQKHLKRVVLGLDLFAMNGKWDERPLVLKDSFGKNTHALIRQHIQFLADVKSIINTVFSSALRLRTKSLRMDGRLTPAPFQNRELYKDFFNPPPPALIAAKTEKSDDAAPKKGMRYELYEPYEISAKNMDALKYIIDQCKARGIELVIFLTPPMADGEWNAFKEIGIWPKLQHFRLELAKLHPYWDFNYPNTITLVRENYVDGSHFSFEIGDKILARMFSGEEHPKGVPEDFGVYVDAASAPEYVERMNRRFAKWPRQ